MKLIQSIFLVVSSSIFIFGCATSNRGGDVSDNEYKLNRKIAEDSSEKISSPFNRIKGMKFIADIETDYQEFFSPGALLPGGQRRPFTKCRFNIHGGKLPQHGDSYEVELVDYTSMSMDEIFSDDAVFLKLKGTTTIIECTERSGSFVYSPTFDGVKETLQRVAELRID